MYKRQKKRWEGNAQHHICRDGETAYSIGQSYGCLLYTSLPVYTPLEWYSVIGYQSPQKTEYFRTEHQIARIVFRIDGSLHLFGGKPSPGVPTT